LGHLRNGEFGRYTTLKEITVAENNGRKNTKVPKTRVIHISEDLYFHFVNFSQRYYNVETYSEILENLLRFYEENHQDTRWYHNNTDRQLNK
jgi:hypothetical protein